FRRASRGSTLAAVLRDTPSPPSEIGAGIPPELERIISRCLQKERDRRFQTMADLKVALDEIRSESSAAGARLAKPAKKRVAWPWWAAAAILTGAVALLVGLDVAGVRTIALQGLFPFQAQSIAVLPLENASRDAKQEFFADGMTSALTANLGSLSKARVISRSSVLRYKGKASEVASIGRELGVDALVTGSAQRVGPAVRIGLELHNAKSGRRLWTRTWERPAAQMPALQREIAEALARRIGSFVGEGARLPVATAPVNEEAYEAYLRGRQLFEQWPRGLGAAAKQFQQAIEKDPLFAPAHAELALTFANLCYFVPPKEAALRARAAAQEALRLDPSAADAHLALAYVKFIHDWDWPGAERDLRKTIELNPNNSKAHHFYAGYLAAMGRVEESILEAKEARILDPMNRLARVQLPWVYYMSRRYDDAIVQYQEILKSDPQNPLAREQLAWCYTLMGRYPEAQEIYAALPAGPDANRIYLDAMSGRRREAEEGLRALSALLEKRYLDPYGTAIAHAALGDRDRAFAYLEKGIEERSAQMPMTRVEPFFDPLRADPRFNQLLEKLKLPR
ncbi:MAG: tetratricopeptide repeat protein, partial [Bryobacter sp.]|nr:tetratricopeptide repeat protein [Bryobacter sp.]